MYNYKNILQLATEQKEQENQIILREHPEMAAELIDPATASVLVYNYDEKQYFLSRKLPNKKGNIDDCYVFQKNA